MKIKGKSRRINKAAGAAVICLGIILLTGCSSAEKKQLEKTQLETTQNITEIVTKTYSESRTAPVQEANTIIIEEGMCLEERFQTPAGFRRTESSAGSLSEFLRAYPLFPDKSPVLLYNGQEKENQSAHAAVFQMNLSNLDRQQCADSVMRMYGEYYWSQGQYEKIAFHFVNGFLCDYNSFRAGKRVKIDGNQTTWVKKAEPDDSWESFQSYLELVFAYASTLSMKEESQPADLEQVQPGDVFLYSGSPGHVVMVVDTCENDKGERAFLLAQGYMPAQQFHVLNNPIHKEDPWYYVSEITWPFETPEYTFQEGSFRRMKY